MTAMAIWKKVKTMSDLISRESAINAVALEIANMFDVTTYDGHEIAEHALSALPSAEAVSRESYINAVNYVEWLEKLIVDSETFEWLCEDTPDHEWCVGNCNYSSIQAECLRHLYEVSKGGDSE